MLSIQLADLEVTNTEDAEAGACLLNVGCCNPTLILDEFKSELFAALAS